MWAPCDCKIPLNTQLTQKLQYLKDLITLFLEQNHNERTLNLKEL